MGGYSGEYNYSSSNEVVSKSASVYNDDHNRRYSSIEEKIPLPSPLGKILQTSAKFPLVIATDITGSMRHFPKLIFEKLCILYNESLYILPKKLKDDFEISFAAIGDAYSDKYPIQITDFAKEKEIDINIDNLYPEGGGGGQTKETYELIAYYYLNKCNIKASKKNKPVMIFIGDEGYYSQVNLSHIQNHIGDTSKDPIDSKEVFNKLQDKFEVYILRIPYSDRQRDQTIHKQWVDTLGSDRVLLMKEPERVIDIILGIVAHHVNGFQYFKERLEIRQTKSQIDTVYSNLEELYSKDKDGICENCGSKIKSKDHEFCPYCGTKL